MNESEFKAMALRVAESCGKHEKLQDAYLRYAFRIRDELTKEQEPVFEIGFGWLQEIEVMPKGTLLYLHPATIPADMVQRKPEQRYLSDYENGCLDGWNDCCDAMIAAYELDGKK